jgi:hypothetical protein
VLDNIADWRTQQVLATATPATTASVTTTSVSPPISVATSTIPNLATKPPSIDGATGPSLTADGSSKVQTKIPYSAPSTSVQVSTYPNVLPIATSAPRNVKFSLPSFVTLASGATPKGSYQPFFNPPDTTQMTRPTGVTTVTSSMATRPSVFPNVRSQTFTPQTNTLPFVENIGSDCGADFQDPRTRCQNKKRGNGQQQQQRPPPPPQQQQRQSPQLSDYQKMFEYMERQIAEQKLLLDEALKRKQPSEADLIQKICRELAAEAAAKGPGDSFRNVPEQAGQTQGSASQPSRHSQPSQNQQPPGPEERVEELLDHGRPPPFYHDYFTPRGNLSDGIYRPRSGSRQQQPPPPPPEQTAPPQSGAEASSELPSGIPSFSFGFRQPTADPVRQSPGSTQYYPPGSTCYRDEDYRTNKQRPLFKPKRHTFDATPKTEQWTIIRAPFDAAVGSRQMADSAKLLMLLDLLGGEPKKIAQQIAGEEYNTRSYIQVWHTLEEHYGGLNRAKKDILQKLKTFPNIAKFNKDNALEFSSLILNILNKYANQGPGLIHEG